MSLPPLVRLSEVRRADAERVGGKAAALGELRAAGFPVPDGLCLTTDAFRLALAPYRARVEAVGREWRPTDPGRATGAADAIARILADLRPSEAVAAALSQALPGLVADGQPLAVRSSATAEDRADRSFAGQYASFLGVRGLDGALDAVVRVWRSFFSASALIARGADDDEAMAVLFMPMVDAECSGVCFSIDPVRQQRDLALVEAAWGLGPGTVDGTVASDAYWVLRHGWAREDRRVVEKAEQVALAPEGGLTTTPVPEERRRAAVLPDPWLTRVVQTAVLAEGLLDAPQDVEWAIADEKLWLLQSRPITTLPSTWSVVAPFPFEWASDEERRRTWHLNDMTRRRTMPPLELDLLAGFEKSEATMCFWRGDRERWVVRVVRGRVYFGSEPTAFDEGDRRVRRRAADDLAVRLREADLTPWQRVAPEVIRATERFDEATAALEGNDGAKLAEHLEDARGLFARHWTVHWLVFESDKLFEPLHAAVEAATGEPKEAAEQIAAKLIEGEETKLTRLIDGLYELGRLASARPAVAEHVRESHRAVTAQTAEAAAEAALAECAEPSPPDDPSARLAALPDGSAFRARLEAFLAEFGHRVGAGFGSDVNCYVSSWREDPRKVLALAAPYLDAAIEPPARRRERARAERDAWLERLCRACPEMARADELRRQVAYGRRLATDLEEHNHYIDQLTFGQLRHALALAADWLVGRGALARRDDAFWLTLDELLGALRAGSPAPLGDRVAERRAQHAAWRQETPPPLVGAPDAKLDKRAPFKDELTAGAPPGATRLEGEAASPGRHRGRARVVASTLVLPSLEPGDVLVAENAGPQWTPLFPILGAIVLDEGALTQHAATTAREYGVPCVIRTRNATHRIPDGAQVVVDGAAGTVEIEAVPEQIPD